jgi:hypothetical protein
MNSEAILANLTPEERAQFDARHDGEEFHTISQAERAAREAEAVIKGGD